MITIEEVMKAIQPSKKLDLRFLYDMDESLKMDEAAIQNVFIDKLSLLLRSYYIPFSNEPLHY